MKLLSFKNYIIKHPLLFLLIIYYIFSCFTMVNWWAHREYGITGDEPHYLVIADGIINHGTFEQSTPYSEEFNKRRIYPTGLAPIDAIPTPQNTHATLGPNGLYNMHNIGLPLLVAIPYKLGSILFNLFQTTSNFNYFGILFVKLFLILISGLLVVATWKITQFFTNKEVIRIITTAIICLAYPFIPASNQIYPELIAGIILLFAVIFLMENFYFNKNNFNLNRLIFLSLAIAFLPWLQIKFTLAALILVISITFIIYKNKNKFTYLITPCIFLCSIGLLSIYNLHAFGNMLGPYKEGALEFTTTSLMVFFGLLLDRFQGLFFQNLSFLTIFLFLIQFIRKFWFVGLIILIIFTSIIIPNSLHPNWYGGWSFAGRFQWVGVITIIPLISYALITLIENFPRMGKILFGAFLLFNFSTFLKYNFFDFNLYNKFGVMQSDAYPSFVPFFKNILPAMYNVNFAYKFIPNYAWLLIILIMLILGFFLKKGIKRKIVLFFSGLCIIILVVTVFLMPKDPLFNKIYLASDLPSQVGTIIGYKRVAIKTKYNAGFLSFGPYIDLSSGTYKVTINYSSMSEIKQIVGWSDVYINKENKTFSHEILYGTNGMDKSIDLIIEIKKPVKGLETRVWFNGLSQISLANIIIQENPI